MLTLVEFLVSKLKFISHFHKVLMDFSHEMSYSPDLIGDDSLTYFMVDVLEVL